MAQRIETWVAWFASVTLPPAVSEALVLTAIVLVLSGRVLLRRTRLHDRLDSALALLALGLAAGAIAFLGPRQREAGPFLYIYAFFIGAVAIGTARALLVLFVDFHLRRRRGAAVSRIFSDVGSVLIYFLIIVAVLRFTLDLNLTSLVATSAVLTAIVGLALQDVLGSVVSGLVLEVEDPFGPGEWIRVGNYEGKVIETGWRTTRIRTRVNEVITLPNTYMAREPVVNYSRPDVQFGETIRFEAAYEAPPDLVKNAVFEILRADPAVLDEPPIEVRTELFNANGVQYALRFWIDDFDERERIHARVMSNLWYALRRHDVRIPLNGHEVFLQSEVPRPRLERGEMRASIARIPLCAALEHVWLDRLALQAQRRLFGDGEVIVRQGDAGDSFFIVEHGRAGVSITPADGSAPTSIAELRAGDYFGEMSLLTGERRSATVTAMGAVSVLEIGRAVFQEIAAADPAVFEPISKVAAQRSADQQQWREAARRAPNAAKEVDEQHLLQRIRTWFHV